ncbi:hypothetical protein [uncultured Draconibacterium sp.]|uniref:hypothetical protein n=1 Tax=uncultured Draconibacterium sp. TaxID=1573823 RepID=UPI003749A436
MEQIRTAVEHLLYSPPSDAGKSWLQTLIGMAVSKGMINWKFQGTILKEGGTRELDNSMARHCSVSVKDGRAFIFYHLEPWRRYDLEKKKGDERVRIFDQPLKNRESVP